MPAYYNENDPFAAAWLRNLIAAGHIAQGEVDERSIEEVRADDIKNFTQCHFFAGIGVWSYSLRGAGWPDDRKVWTGSCPCQSFSTAGKRKGFDDKRHLWPEWFRLIRECKPDTIFGEQVASKDALAWLDLVSFDLEGAGYAVGAVDTCAAGFGAPHIRQRFYWVADSGSERRQQIGRGALGDEATDGRAGWNGSKPHGDNIVASDSEVSIVAHSNGRLPGDGILQRSGEQRQQQENGGAGELELPSCLGGQDGQAATERQGRFAGASDASSVENARYQPERGSAIETSACISENGSGSCTSSKRSSSSYWSTCDWLPCTDGKSRPVEPGTFPLAHGSPNRVGRLRGYGNALVAPQAQAFIESFMEI